MIFFESHPITKNTLNRPYEFVLIGTSAFDHSSLDTYSFSGKFNDPDNSNKLTTTFYNLGGDSMLIAPKPRFWKERKTKSLPINYVHIKSFLEFASLEENLDILNDFWSTVGFSLEKRIEEISKNGEDDVNMWFSTCGTGVYFLHVRLDSYPKYYSFSEYRNGNLKLEEVKYGRDN